jgi:hypothetical protein
MKPVNGVFMHRDRTIAGRRSSPRWVSSAVINFGPRVVQAHHLIEKLGGFRGETQVVGTQFGFILAPAQSGKG